MNDVKYIANLFVYTLTKDNFNEGEDPSTTQTFECNVRHIKFNTVSELKDEIASRVLFDSAYRRNMFITHLEGNEYGVDWTSEDENINVPVDEETMEKFKNGDVIRGLYLDCDVPLWEMSDSSGRSILRLIIPDKQNRLPEESDEPFKWQMLCTQLLYAGDGPAN